MFAEIIKELYETGGGIIPSPDYTNYNRLDEVIVGVGGVSIPDEFIPEVWKIQSQGTIKRCFPESFKYVRKVQEAFEFNLPAGQEDDLSSGFIYFNRIAHIDVGSGVGKTHVHQRPGMIPSEALESAKRDGICLNSVWTSTSEYFVKDGYIPEKAFVDAAKRKIGDFFRLATEAETRSAILENGPVIWCVPVYDYWASGFNKFIRLPDLKKDKLLGYHAMARYAWQHPDKGGAMSAVNSWGHKWGDKGVAHFHPDYPVKEAWGVVDAITNEADKPKPKNYQIKVFINDQPLDTATQPVAVGGRILVPVRAIFERMGATVVWNDKDKLILGVKGNKTVQMALNSTTAIVLGPEGKKEIQLDVPPLIVNDRALAPLRFVAEIFGGTVEWDGRYQTAFIKK